MLDVNQVVKQFRDESIRLANIAHKYDTMATQLSEMNGNGSELETTVHFFNRSETASKRQEKPKRYLSPEGKQRIVEAARRRWAAQKTNNNPIKAHRGRPSNELIRLREQAARARAAKAAKANLKKLQEGVAA